MTPRQTQNQVRRCGVVVVGAGLAGLHAAWRLHAGGADVIVLEANDRVGGRTWSRAIGDGTVVERGGEFIGSKDRCLHALCDELDLELIPHGFSFDRRTTPGQSPPTEAELHAFDAAARARLAAAGGEDRPADELLPPPGERTARQSSIIRRIETSLTVPLSGVSGARLFGGGNHHYDPAARVHGGNDRIARELASRLDDRLRLGAAVVGVECGLRSTTVHLADGATVEASAVVLALPLPLLLGLRVRPGLPEPILAAAHGLLFGDAAKLHIPLAAAPSIGGVASPEGLWWCWVSAARGGADGAPVLSGFAGGASTIERAGIDAGSLAWGESALRLRPDVAARGRPSITHWGAQEWARGSYSAPRVGATPDWDAAWAARHGSLVFAGEHTAGRESATMNGAALSGARAAHTVLQWLGS